MGCVQTKGITDTPPRVLERLKLENGYVKGAGQGGRTVAKKEVSFKNLNSGGGGGGGGGGGQRKHGGGGERNGGGGGGSGSERIMVKKISADEMVDGWPKWLVDNIPTEVLAGLVPRSADSYDKLAKVGQGTYSNVYKARDRDTGKIVALKKVRFDTSEPESVKFMAREIIMLQRLDHPNIIQLEGLATSRMQYSLYLVFDFMQSDLMRVISRQEGRLTEPQVKCYMQQLLSGLQHCHERGILHRDIKGSNLLIDKNGMLKIADFGLANIFQPRQKRPLTSRVVTLWYRAPELLLGSTDYGVGIDLWSAGCLLAEMFVGRPIMPGRTEVEQLHRIFKLCGSPTEDYWKRMKPPTTFRPPQQYKPSFQEYFTNLPSSSFSLLTTLLALEPAYRGTAASALQNEFFSSSPLACVLSGLPAMNKEEDEPIQTNDRRKKRASKTKKLSQKNYGVHGRKDSITEQAKEEFGSFKEQDRNAETSLQSQEMGGTSASSSTSSRKQSRTDQSSPPLSPYPAFHINRNQSSRTEAHPNAMRNIKNFPILLASLADTGNHITIEDNRLTLNRRSISTVDFRTIDLDKISKLFGLEDK
ncbi:probable serine/threonine-protein kinase At1g54610 isoform X1 [Actinidia eriantha]|uniref:probable serine/threonine-protein kinase At1g54610 isoform X1 n=1 Tax=Actinidia eriantha TaxID=165200 RepID=UPI00258471E5|nr:probable serine/threonine-protein kinase At1g54610 isoform X1 [Actinidia eriantha]